MMSNAILLPGTRLCFVLDSGRFVGGAAAHESQLPQRTHEFSERRWRELNVVRADVVEHVCRTFSATSL